MQGPLLSTTNKDSQCVCTRSVAGKGGMITCSEVASNDCNEGDWQIRIPNGFYKVIIEPSINASWAFQYTKAQTDQPGTDQPECSGACESIADAFASTSVDLQVLLTKTKFDWNFLEKTASTKCQWCPSDTENMLHYDKN
jgi:hypothetical protein|tara:strand:- start:148 stop:567 length:420 start_codon:yes stop_codon:yes gene_type:complete